MSNVIHRAIGRLPRVWLLAVGIGASAAQSGWCAAIPVSDFFRAEQFSDAQLSPDGKTVAMLRRDQNDNLVLAVMPTDARQPSVIAGLPETDIVDVHWVNNRRLVYSASTARAGALGKRAGVGLYAIDIAGGKSLQVVMSSWLPINPLVPPQQLGPDTHYLRALPGGKSNEVYVTNVEARRGQFDGLALYRLDTTNGKSTRVIGPDNAIAWVIDENGEPSVATTHAGGTTAIHVREPSSGTWRKLTEFSATKGEAFWPSLMTADGKLFGLAYNGRNTKGLYQYDFEHARLEPEPVIGLKHYDFDGQLLLGADRNTALGVRYETSEAITTWFDAAMLGYQQRIDSALPATINELSVAASGDVSSMLVHSYSDQEPGYWQLYHSADGSFTRLGAALPDIKAAQMASMQMVRYKARDGLEIPAYLTLPADVAGHKAPMLVLVHGGPWTRGGHLRWNAQAQFLASRGYAVLEPEFRGSTGFGKAHFEAGWKQWGLAMQDDLADGARWAAAQGYADPGRICIGGAGYGGYAALMGLINDPALYRCGIDWLGMTDIDAMFEQRWSDPSAPFKVYGMPVLLGDPRADAARFKATSPLQNAARISQPLMLAYGGEDQSVPLAQGSQLYRAVKAGNPQLDWTDYPLAGHGWDFQKDRVDFWTRVEAFLAKHDAKP